MANEELKKIEEMLTKWAGVNEKRAVILLSIDEDNMCGNVVSGRRNELVKSVMAGMANTECGLTSFISKAAEELSNIVENGEEYADKIILTDCESGVLI